MTTNLPYFHLMDQLLIASKRPPAATACGDFLSIDPGSGLVPRHRASTRAVKKLKGRAMSTYTFPYATLEGSLTLMRVHQTIPVLGRVAEEVQ